MIDTEGFSEFVKQTTASKNDGDGPTAQETWDFLQDQIADLKRQVEENEASFNLRRDADMRAIKRWQEATGQELVWPHHADLCLCLCPLREA